MKFRVALARILSRLCGIDPQELDLVFREAMAFTCTPIMFSFGWNRISNIRTEADATVCLRSETSCL